MTTPVSGLEGRHRRWGMGWGEWGGGVFSVLPGFCKDFALLNG